MSYPSSEGTLVFDAGNNKHQASMRRFGKKDRCVPMSRRVERLIKEGYKPE